MDKQKKNCWVVEYKLKGEKEWEAEKWFPLTEAVSLNGQTVSGICDDDRFCVNEGRAAVYVSYQNKVWGDKIKYRYRADYAEWLEKPTFINGKPETKEYNWIFRRTEWAS